VRGRTRLVVAVAVVLVAAACTSASDPSTTTLPATTAPPATTPTTIPATTTAAAPTVTVAPPPPADLVLTNGEVVTVDADFTIAQAVAVTGGDIVAVGSSEEIAARVGPETTVVDLGGRALLPGLIDPHTHALQIHAFAPQIDAMLAAQDDLLAGGVTTIGSPNVKPDDLAGFTAFEDAGDVVVRDHLYLTYDDECGERPFGDYYLSHEFSRDPELRQTVAGAKIFTDGGVCNAPAFSIPYPDTVPQRLKDRGWVGNGDLYVTPEEVADVVGRVDTAGGITVIHAIGDLGIEVALEGLARANDARPFANPQRIDHNSATTLLRDEELRRYGELDMVPAVFTVPYANACDPATTDAWRAILPGPVFDVIENSKALREANPQLRISWHGDAPSVPGHPLQLLFTAVSGGAVNPDTGEICYPEAWSDFFTVPPEEAIRMMTINAAAAMGIDERVGSIEVGKVADLVVLAADPLDPDPEVGFATNRPLVTMINGEADFCDGDLCDAVQAITATHAGPTEPAPPGVVLEEGPTWTFDHEGDPEGWVAVNDMGSFAVTSEALVIEIVGDDPWMESPRVTFPATASTLSVRMRVTGGGDTVGQLFFVTESDPAWSEGKSRRFDVVADGEFHDYTVDLSTVPGWEGRITQVRLDPVEGTGYTVAVDEIGFGS